MKKPDITRTIIYNFVIVIVIVVGILDSLWIYQAYQKLDKEVKNLRKNYLEKQKKIVRNEVQRIVDYIEYRKKVMEREEKETLINNANSLCDKLRIIYTNFIHEGKEKCQKRILKEIYSKTNNNNTYSLACDYNGNLFSLPVKNYETSNSNIGFIKNIIKKFKKRKHFSKIYSWQVKGESLFKGSIRGESEYIKFGVIKFFKPLNLFIILGANIENLTDKIQADILGWVEKLHFPRNEYFFIDKYDGTQIVFDGKKVSRDSQKLSTVNYNLLVNYKTIAWKIINTTGRGFIYYPINVKQQNPQIYHKVSYIWAINDWSWIVGAGVYMEDIEAEIDLKKQKLEISTIFHISQIVLLLLGFIILSLLIANFIIRKAQKNFNAFYKFFEQSTKSSELLKPEEQTYREFEILAHSVNNMIQKRLEIEYALRYSQKRFKDIAESMADLIWETDPEMKFTYVSEKIEKIIGYSPGEFLGKSCLDIYLKNCDKEIIDEFIDLVENKKNIEDMNIWIFNKKIEKICLQTNAIPYFSNTGAFMGYRGVSKDITYSVQATAELRKHKENLEFLVDQRTKELAEKQAQLMHSGRLTALGEMAAGMAHEINQPLSTIRFVLNNINMAMKKEALTQTYYENKSSKINSAVDKISNIINHVRVFSREQTGKDSCMLHSFPVKDSIDNALQLIKQQFKNYNISLKVGQIDKNLQVLGDVYKLEQVIINLLTNAKDAVLEKLEKAVQNYQMEIAIYAEKQNSNIIITIEDNGIGIPKENTDKILNPFFTTKEAGKGTGLGLSISYGIIQEMNGKINFVSSDNGTKVLIILPARITDKN